MRFLFAFLAACSGLAPAPASPTLRALFLDTQRVAQETGLRSAVARTLQSQRAVAETVLELASELPKPPHLSSVAEALRIATQTASSPKGSTVAMTDLAQAALKWGNDNVSPDLAPKFLRKLCERLGATYVKLGCVYGFRRADWSREGVFLFVSGCENLCRGFVKRPVFERSGSGSTARPTSRRVGQNARSGKRDARVFRANPPLLPILSRQT